MGLANERSDGQLFIKVTSEAAFMCVPLVSERGSCCLLPFLTLLR